MRRFLEFARSLVPYVRCVSGILISFTLAMFALGFLKISTIDTQSARMDTLVAWLIATKSNTMDIAAKRSVVAHAFGNCGFPVCRITQSPGGLGDTFEYAADILNSLPDGKLVIDGRCASACVLAADRARAKTCITPRAEFAFHKARYHNVYELFGTWTLWIFDTFSDPGHSPDIDDWVYKHGGYPYFSMLTMSNEEAQKFWRTCM